MSAIFEGLCIGWATYQEGEAAALTVWGDDDMTEAVDGIPEGKPFRLVITRASTGAETAAEATITFENHEPAIYRSDAIFITQRLQAADGSGDASSVGTPLAVEGVKASSDDGNVPAGAVDGEASTRWSAKGKQQWLRLDLGQRRRLGAIEIAWFSGERRQAFFDVEISEDGARWQRAFAGTSGGRTSGPERYALSGAGRFVRIVGHGNSDNDWNSITEVSVYGSEAAQASVGELAGTPPETTFSAAKGALVEAAQEVPTSYALDQNYPNPFNPSTTITYRLPQATKVTLTIYDAVGRRVRRLVNSYQQAGEYRVRWNGRNAAGAPVGSGLYAYQIEAETFRRTRTMVLVK